MAGFQDVKRNFGGTSCCELLAQIICVRVDIDYCIANFLLALVFALTLGQIGNATVSPNFFTQISQHNGAAVGAVPDIRIACKSSKRSLRATISAVGKRNRSSCLPLHWSLMLKLHSVAGFAMAGGVFLCLGNLLMQVSTELFQQKALL